MERRARPHRKRLVEDAGAVVLACTGLGSRLAARRITLFLDRRMAASGLTIAEFGLLAQAAAGGADRPGALAERVGLDQLTLSSNLEAAGLRGVAAADKDLRRRVVLLTKRGAHRPEAAIGIRRQGHPELAKRLDPALAHRLEEATCSLVDAAERRS